VNDTHTTHNTQDTQLRADSSKDSDLHDDIREDSYDDIDDDGDSDGDGDGDGRSVIPVTHPARTGSRWEARITFLRSRAAVARAEVSAIEALHRDPDALEDLLMNASPDDVAMAEAVEHRISERVIAARQVADAAESDYERAVLDGPDLQLDDTV
jgi:hypothetical protein